MTIDEFKEYIRINERVEGGSEAHQLMHSMSQDALRITMEINNKYHTHEELLALMSELTGAEVNHSVCFLHSQQTVARI